MRPYLADLPPCLKRARKQRGNGLTIITINKEAKHEAIYKTGQARSQTSGGGAMALSRTQRKRKGAGGFMYLIRTRDTRHGARSLWLYLSRDNHAYTLEEAMRRPTCQFITYREAMRTAIGLNRDLWRHGWRCEVVRHD